MKFIRALVFASLFAVFFVLGSKINAQDATPIPPNPVACNNVASPEFHSLRPYQKNSSCQSETSNFAKFCGNRLTLQESITKTYDPKDPNCKTKDNKVVCLYTEKIPPHSVTIKLSGANLPIMGNTEEVTNYKGEADQLNDAQKTNEYVSWYLNGANNRAEYSTTEDGRKIIDFSGPINKLLPEKIQRNERVATIRSAKETRHDQIVGCVYNLLGLFKVGQIVECYPKTIDKSVVRLSDWEKNNHIPPKEEDFKNYGDYLIALKRWRGKSCITLSGISLCFDNPLKPNYWGNLFQNIPLSSTEDLEGNIQVDSFSAGSAGVTNISFANQSPATLFFPHIQESDQLGSALQDTYISKDQQKGQKTGADTAVAPPSSCTTVDVRSNKGDNLFAGSIIGNLSYTASFTCDFNPPTPAPAEGYCSRTCPGNQYCQPNTTGGICVRDIVRVPSIPKTSKPPQTCSKTVYIALSTQSNTPKIDNVWSRLVGGPTAIVKRMFPKLGDQIGTLKDIPGSTGINYQGAQASGELNLPHVGGISEYFLKGIQTLLRPKGYGEPISFGETQNKISCTPGEKLPKLPAASGSCKFKNLGTIGSANLSNLPSLVKIIEAASQSYSVPPGLLLGVMYGEGAFEPGRYEWMDENVQTWSCGSMPNCSPNSFPSNSLVPFFEPYWNQFKDAVSVVDPNRTPNPCNLMDATFALAKNLKQGQYGVNTFAGKTCYGINLNTGSGGSKSCSWDNNNYETAIRVWEFGYQYDSAVSCATKPGSCTSGGDLKMTCANGDTCEKLGGSGNTSHNACIWNVAHSH